MPKTLSIALILVLTASSLTLTSLASAQAPKLSTPEFTAKFVDHSYDVPQTTEQNQFTGEVTVIPAHKVQNYTVELTIKNQPYTQVGGASWTEFRYDVNVNGHYAQNWTIMYLTFEGPKRSNETYTTITYWLVYSPTDQTYELTHFFDDPYSSNSITDIPPDSTLDFQVRAMNGAMHRGNNPNETNPLLRYQFVYEGETSDWSSTQTVNIPKLVMDTAGSQGLSNVPVDAADVQGNDLIVVAVAAAIIVAVIAVAAVMVKRARTQAAT